MVHKKDKAKSRTKSKQQKGFFNRIFRKVFSCIAAPNENLKPAPRRSRRTLESPKKPERLRDRFELVRTSLRGPSRGHKEGPRRRPLFETSLHSAERHEVQLDSENYQFPTPQTIPLFVPIAQAPIYSAEEASNPIRCTSSEINYNNALVASQYAHAPAIEAIEAPKLFPGDQEWLLPVDDVRIGTFQPNNLSNATVTGSDNGMDLEVQGIIGLGIQNISCDHPTIEDQDIFAIPNSMEWPLSHASSPASDTDATIGESCSRPQGGLNGVPGFNSLPRYRPTPKIAPNPMWRAPCPAPIPPGLGEDSDNSSISSDRTTNRSAASSASSLSIKTHSPYAYEPYPGGRLDVRSAGPVEAVGISAWTYAFPMPAFMFPTMFTPPPSSHTLSDNQPGFNDIPMNSEEHRTQPRRNGARRKRERRVLGTEGSIDFAKRDIGVTINGPRAKQQNKKSTKKQDLVQRSEVTRSAPGSRAKARSRRGWKEREGTKFGGIRDGKENLVLAVEEGTTGRDSASHQDTYGRAGKSHRTRAEMQPTVESAPPSVVSSLTGSV